MMKRVSPTWHLEQQLAQEGATIVFGFDEVGRGALAGPVMVGCAAIFSRRLLPRAPKMPKNLADSKMLTEREREKLFAPLGAFVDAWAVGAASNREIDQAGITHALGLAALRALATCEKKIDALAHPTALLPRSTVGILDGPFDYITPAASTVDAPRVPILPRIVTCVHGDARCAIVSAASDLAKVTRDRLMERLSRQEKYAPYGWASNRGYGTKAHREAIRRLGATDLHRITWHLV